MLANLQIKNHGYSVDMETEDQSPYTVSLYLFPQSLLYLPHQNNNNNNNNKKNSLLSGQVCYHYTTVAADFLLEQECSKLEHGMINMPQIEGGEGYYSFRDGLRQRWVKDHCFLFCFVLFFCPEG